MKPSAAAFVAKANSQAGKPYRFGAEVRLDDPEPKAFDCSELVQWALAQVGVQLPDGSWNQCGACHPIPLSSARATPGALVFVSRDGKACGVCHVGISRGDGYTVEARGRAWGVGVWPWRASWNLAGLVPGLAYAEPRPPYGGAGGDAGDEGYTIKIGDRPLLGVEGKMSGGRLWVPLRALAAHLGYEVYAPPDLTAAKTVYLFERGESQI